MALSNFSYTLIYAPQNHSKLKEFKNIYRSGIDGIYTVTVLFIHRQQNTAARTRGRLKAHQHQQPELVMNAACPVSLAEIENDPPVSSHQLAIRSEIRMEVIDVAERIIRGEKLGMKVLRHGIPYTKDQAMIDFVEHALCDDAIFAAWNGDRMPLTDLLTRIVQRVVAVAWYGESDADTLGFSK